MSELTDVLAKISSLEIVVEQLRRMLAGNVEAMPYKKAEESDILLPPQPPPTLYERVERIDENVHKLAKVLQLLSDIIQQTCQHDKTGCHNGGDADGI
jgi:hypothetical protein